MRAGAPGAAAPCKAPTAWASWPGARRIRLSEPECTVGCCGGVHVTVRREGDRVVRGPWENTGGVKAVPEDVYFDAAQYEAELERPRRTAAGSSRWTPSTGCRRPLLMDSGWFGRWGCEPAGVWPRREEPAEEQARRLAAHILADDPRKTAELWEW